MWASGSPSLHSPQDLGPDGLWPDPTGLSHAAVRSRASIAVAPLDSDSPYLGASGALPGDPASCSVLGSLNLHLHRDPALLGFRWPLYSTSFPEEAALETDAELGSQPSLSRFLGFPRGRRAWLGIWASPADSSPGLSSQLLRTQRFPPNAHQPVAPVAQTAAVCQGRSWARAWRTCPT